MNNICSLIQAQLARLGAAGITAASMSDGWICLNGTLAVRGFKTFAQLAILPDGIGMRATLEKLIEA